MGCFLVPAAEAIVTTVISHGAKKREKNIIPETFEFCDQDGSLKQVEKVRFSTKLGWLNKMLIGGSGLLAFEHVWHGEVVPFFPFLTAANDPAEFAELLTEMSTTGVTMAILVTLIWGGMVFVSNTIEKKAVNKGELRKVEG